MVEEPNKQIDFRLCIIVDAVRLVHSGFWMITGPYLLSSCKYEPACLFFLKISPDDTKLNSLYNF